MRNRPQRGGGGGSWSGIRCLSGGGGVVVSVCSSDQIFTQKPEAAEKEPSERPSVRLF